MKIKYKTIENVLLIVTLFLMSMNFMAKFYYFAFAAFIILLLFNRKLCLDFSCVPYALLSVIMSLYNSGNGIMAMLRVFAFVFMYIVGMNVVESSKDSLKPGSEDKTAYKFLAVITMGAFAHYLMKFIYNFGTAVSRNTLDVWSNATMAATGQAALCSMAIGLSVAFILLPKTKFIRIIGIILTAFILLYNLILAGRTIMMVYLIVFIAAMYFIYRNLKNKSKRYKYVLGVLLFLLAVLIAYNMNIGGIKNTLESSNLFLRFFDSPEYGLTSDSRMENKISYITNAFSHLGGGLYLRNRFGYAHDLLLDAYDEYGLLTFIVLLFILINGIKELYYFTKNNQIDMFYRLPFLCVYIAILLEFWVEPIFPGMPWIFACYSLINGMLKGVNRSYRKRII